MNSKFTASCVDQAREAPSLKQPASFS